MQMIASCPIMSTVKPDLGRFCCLLILDKEKVDENAKEEKLMTVPLHMNASYLMLSTRERLLVEALAAARMRLTVTSKWRKQKPKERTPQQSLIALLQRPTLYRARTPRLAI